MTERDPPGGPAHPSQQPPPDRGRSPSGPRNGSQPRETRPARDAAPRGDDETSSHPPPRGAAEDEKRVLPELVRRIFEAGIERLAEGPENVRQRLGDLKGDLKLPKEALSAILAQIDEGKSGLYRALTKELRDFLENTNFTEDLVRALTMLSFEIKMEIRLIPNDSGRPRPRVKSNVQVHNDDRERVDAASSDTHHTGKRP